MLALNIKTYVQWVGYLLGGLCVLTTTVLIVHYYCKTQGKGGKGKENKFLQDEEDPLDDDCWSKSKADSV